MKKTIIIFLDAIRKDYITKSNTPFLYQLKEKNTYLDLVSLLGYSAGIHPSIWSGKHQEETNKFLIYSFNEKKDQFGWIRFLKYVPSKLRQYIIGALKVPFYMWSLPKSFFPTWYRHKILPLPASIDPSMARFFKKEDTSFEKPFFDILTKNNITYSSQPDYDNDWYGKGVGLQNWDITDKDVDFFFSWDCDSFGHYPGPNSEKLLSKMNEYDQVIKKLILNAKQRYSDFNLFIFSDHGMEEVKGNINVKDILNKSKLKPIKDYVVFYDSTMVRFWVKDELNKQKIIDLLKDTENLTYLDKKLKSKYHINFKEKKWGDLFFLANNGHRIFPDYFSPVRFNTKGLHGYFPDKTHNAKGIFITNTFKTSSKEIKVTEIFSKLLKSLNLKE